MQHSLANHRVTGTPKLGQLFPPPHMRSDLGHPQPRRKGLPELPSVDRYLGQVKAKVNSLAV